MAIQPQIPIYTFLKDHDSIADQSIRRSQLSNEFERRFGRKPTHIKKRTLTLRFSSLIGEHIDYALFGVFPAAIERDILIACAPRASHERSYGAVEVQNIHSKYLPRSFTPIRKPAFSSEYDEGNGGEWDLNINNNELRWESYVKAGYYGVLNRFFSAHGYPVPVDLLIAGTVPAGSGLSSSAALVVASTLAFLAVNNKLEGVTKHTLVEMAMENEKRVGVNSGGMDQAASVLSTPSSALYVSFYPHLTASPAVIPRGTLVLASSCITSEKATHARTRYNLRVVETLVAARILARHLNIHVGSRERITLREVVGRFCGEPEGGWLEDSGDLRAALEKTVGYIGKLRPASADSDGQEGVTLETMIEWSGLSEEDFNKVYLSWVDVEATHFQLYKRARHVLTEALRVLRFRDICIANHEGVSDAVLCELGELMNASQTSCSVDYDCSCQELDQLTQICRDAGAYGSRLTGAGWGGFTVSLVAEDRVTQFVETLRLAYEPFNNLGDEALAEVLFSTKPSGGACVYVAN
ncbi:Galactokinase [Multifurca ochricompacta]|uniref:Galactokinase n=1 Tax=Multifurca ochricompacta TaxID=376703 RepID=A0AAD4QQ21_9AGAM|nr:Galactokinase [Multifurca ochricompacta]